MKAEELKSKAFDYIVKVCNNYEPYHNEPEDKYYDIKSEIDNALSKLKELYDNLADALGYEEGTKIVYVPYDTTPYIPPQRITNPYWDTPYPWRWTEPYVITSGYSQIVGEDLNTGSVTTCSCSTTEKG